MPGIAPYFMALALHTELEMSVGMWLRFYKY